MTDLFFFLSVITALRCFTGSLLFIYFFENMSASAVQNVFPQGTAGAVCVSQAALAGF